MNKNEFMEILSEKLSTLSTEDREDAVNYYWEYFEEAGFGDESDVTKNVGMPEDVAEKIMEAAEHVKETGLSVITNSDIISSESSEDFDSIDIELSTLDVIVKTGDKFGVLINCKDKKPVVEVANRRLTIRDEESFGFSGINFNFNIFNKEKEFVEITVPKDKKLREVKSRLGFGKISLFSVNSDSLDIKADMGSLETVGVISAHGKFSANMGHVSVKDGKFEKLIVESNTGAVNIKYSEAEHLKVSTDTGYISMNRVNAKEADLVSHTGYIKLTEGRTDRLSVGTNTGLIKLDGTDVGSLEANSNTGSISAKLVGVRDKYLLDLANSLGIISVDGKNSGMSIFGNRYKDNTGEIPVKMRVDTGKINVDFLRR